MKKIILLCFSLALCGLLSAQTGTMYAAAKEAVDRARSGGGPTLIEALTFRFHGHVFGDMDGYMKKGEKEEAMARDPIPAWRN